MEIADNTNTAEDPFGFMAAMESEQTEAFGVPATDDEPQGAAPMEEVPQQEGAQPEEQQISIEEQRIRDWQAKHDTLQSEFDQYKRQSEDANKLWQYVQNDPSLAQNVFATIEQSLSGTGSSAQAAESTEPQEPARPEAPAGYNEHDAYTDPESESFRHRKAMDAWRQEHSDWKMDRHLRQVQQMVTPIAQTFEQEQQARQQHAYLQQITQSFTEYGVDPSQAPEVTSWAANYQVTPEDIVALYRMKNGAQPQVQPQQNAAADRLQDRNQRLSYPLPSSTSATQAQTPTAPPEEQMIKDLIAMDRQSNPWT